MQSRKLASGSAVVVATIVLSGCSGSLLESKKIDYKSAAVAPTRSTLEIPPDLTAPTADDRYAVPDINPKGTATFSAYNAERSGQAASGGAATPAVTRVAPQSIDKMRVERSGSQRWLVVPGTADKLWPQVREFWQENGFILNVDRPEIGVMETDWAENRAKIDNGIIRNTIGKVIDGLYSTPERDKFRTRLESAGESGFVEIFISHRGMMEIYPNEAKDRTIWQPRQADPELEADVAACEAQWAKESTPRRRANSKQAEVIRMLQRPEGATIGQICTATGWQAHTVRGTFAGAFKKKLGLTITSDKAQGGERVYRVA